MFCPQCGANQLVSPSASATDEFAPEALPRGLGNRLHAYMRKLSGRWTPYDGYRDPALDDEAIRRQRRWHRTRRWLYVCGGLAAVAFAAYQFMPGDGPMDGAQMAGGAAPADSAMGAQAEPPPGDDIDIAGLNVPSAQGQPDADVDLTGLNIASEPSAPDAMSGPPGSQGRELASRSDANARIDVTRQLAIARTDLSRNSLWPARHAVVNALSAQPGNADALRLLAELASRERERDSLIEHARQCERSGQRGCAREYARRAVSVDRSSRDAKRLLARASGNRRETVVRRDSPNLFTRLHHWFKQSLAQADARPVNQSSSPWERP